MIFTSNYKTFENSSYKTRSISGDRGKSASFKGECYPKLAPKLGLWKVWHNNIGKISEEENNKFYIHEFYEQVLSKLDPEEVSRNLNGEILLCYEEPEDFCHRHIVAAWLELILDIKVPEVNCTLNEIERPSYIKVWLEEEMRKKDLHGFHSIRAAYLFEKANKKDEIAAELEMLGSYLACGERQYAAYLRSEADMIEDAYLKNKVKAKEKK